MPSNPVTGAAPATRSTAAILAVVVLVAVNLRLALSSLPAVATLIQDETGWSDAFIGALTTVPVLGMGVFALGVPRLAGRIGRRSAVSLALVAMAAGLMLRLAGAVAVTLLLSAMLAGLSIAILGGLVPGIVRERLAHSMGLATSLWTAAMMGGAALGAALTLPLADLTGGWNRALAFWALPAVAALVAWLWLERDQPARVATVAIVRLRDLPWRDSTAWALTAFMSVNS
ncbi:MAG: MFS transporter, partial [Actinobacteria bacterium]|nr:MFS transporter [Actinomycetota bacterium]